METLAENIQRIQGSIHAAAARAGRDPAAIELVTVSKTVGAERVREAFAAGLRHFGENRAQELAAKVRALGDLAIEWHFVGHLQTNKVRQVMPPARLIHSVDRVGLAEKIDRRAAPGQQSILIQVNTTGEESKSGIAPGELPALLDACAELPHLTVDGLMTIGPLTGDAALIRAAFRRLRALRDQEAARGRPRAPLKHLSMGMTGDYEIAIEEGATMLRIGTAIFGARN
ncbi:MAG: YggS family pyridoxal phosphate-dependent enzyme [Candidatus Eisenbacteria sp.]|nr:YggS family pyridoxal phosphate-dependent enzyme [Candidatus Eisenbacteria bacterium]